MLEHVYAVRAQIGKGNSQCCRGCRGGGQMAEGVRMGEEYNTAVNIRKLCCRSSRAMGELGPTIPRINRRGVDANGATRGRRRMPDISQNMRRGSI